MLNNTTNDSCSASLRADALEEAVNRCKARIHQDRAIKLLAAKRRAEVVMLRRLCSELSIEVVSAAA